MTAGNQLTAAQEILLAAAQFSDACKSEFTEWDLTVAVWKANTNRFGCRGYETDYPDHKRVMMEIMGRSKKDNPLRRGWIERIRANHYRITSLGLAEAEQLASRADISRPTQGSAQHVYDSLSRYIFHPVFRRYLRDSSEPRTWLGAAAFLGLARVDSSALRDALSTVQNTINHAALYMDDTGRSSIRSGATGGRKTILKAEIDRLPEFLKYIQQKFKPQIDAILSDG